MIKNVRFTDINFIIVLIMLFCCPIDILAQHTICSIAGKVIDEGQNPVPYASVAIYS